MGALVPCEQTSSFGVRIADRVGRLFQADGPATAKARRPYMLSRWRGTCSRSRSTEWRCLWLDSGTQWTAIEILRCRTVQASMDH